MKKTLTIIASLFIAGSLLAEDAGRDSTPCDQLGWKLAIHAYTFRKFSIFECINKTAGLGLKYMSLSGSVSLDGTNSVKTLELSDTDAKAIKDAAAAKGLTLVNIGVVQLPPDEEKSRKVYEFAKKMGIDTLVAEPEPAALDTVEKLCKEYNIKVAIHDHPRPSHYWNPGTVLEAVKGRTPLMGACADTGHWVRSGLDPVECLKKLEGRIITLHFKDLVPDEKAKIDPKKKAESKAMHDVPWGTGVSNVKGQLAELKRQNFRGPFCIEYEYHWENSTPEIAKCVAFFNNQCAEFSAAK